MACAFICLSVIYGMAAPLSYYIKQGRGVKNQCRSHSSGKRNKYVIEGQLVYKGKQIRVGIELEGTVGLEMSETFQGVHN